jgi:voltage-gated potassium channel
MRERIQWIKSIERTLNVPMVISSLAFLILFIASLSVGADSPYRSWFERGIYFIWILFLLEFTLKLIIAPHRLAFIRKNWFDFLVIILPFLRLFRVVLAFQNFRALGILFTAASTGQGILSLRAVLMLKRSAKSLGTFMRLSRFGYVAFVTTLVVFITAGGVLWFERGSPRANIRTYGDALWWSAAVVTTVASDLNPVSTGGRIFGVALMIYGVSVFGYFVSHAVAFIQGREGRNWNYQTSQMNQEKDDDD